ncbi:MAG: alpha/beta fold hydrolase [Acidimicrobiales bacterium]|nr:alpha/beta fold hydrolase [Acidimicrobiales bacterium]
MYQQMVRVVVGLGVAMILATACTGSGVESSGPSDTVEPVETTEGGSDDVVVNPNDDGVELVSQTIDCPFDGPPAVTVGCSRLTVPENWETGEGEISLTFARIPSRSTAASPEAIVYLEGGPGGHALDTLQFQFDDLWDPLLDDYDLIFFDQRGVGYSEPALDCPELVTLTRKAEDDPTLDPETLDAEFVDAVAGCRARYGAEGIDVSQYNTVNNAKDADAIRQVLGYDQWNILGISYGTKLALEMTRQYPETIRASVIDSVYPPQVDGPASNPATFLDSLNLVSAACDAEPACAAEGSLLDRLVNAATALEASPREVAVTNFLTGESDTVQATGDTIVSVVAQGLYSPFGFSDWPELLTDIENGGTDALSTYLSLDRTNEAFFTTGMQLAVQCHEEISFTDPSSVDDLPEDPFGLYDYAFSDGDNFAMCAAMDAGSAPAHQNEPVVSDVPTLILAGEFDPVTPPAWGQLAAETLSNSQFVLVAGESHGVSPSECGNDIVRQFLADPMSPVDASCADDETVVFIADAAAEVDMEATVADFSIGETFVLQPADWNNQNVNGVVDSIRQNSLLDVAELLQFAGPSAVSTSIEGFISGQLDIELTSGSDADIGGVVWQVKRGDNGRVAADLYVADDGANVQLVLLISAVEERSDLVAAVLLPALEGFGRE